MKVTLTLVNPQQKVSPRTGKPYTALSIKTEEYGDRWLSGFGNRDNMNWQPGMQVHITVTEKENPKGGLPYLNFETLDPNIGDILARLDKIEAYLRTKGSPALAVPAAPVAPAPRPAPMPSVAPGLPTHPAFNPAPMMDEPELEDLPF